MKFLETARRTVQKAAAVVKAPTTPRDPWYSDDERKARMNATSGGRWLGPRRRGWLR
jgi:hypothetical protein